MLDADDLRKQYASIAKRLSVREFVLDTNKLQALEAKRKEHQIATEALQQQRNQLSKQIGEAKRKGEAADDLTAKASALGDRLSLAKEELQKIQHDLYEYVSTIPNLPHESVPLGQSEQDNEEIRRWGEPKLFDFSPKDHTDLGEALGLLDFDGAAKITGSRFVILRGALVRLQRALTQFMLDVHTQEHAYTEIYVPNIVHEKSLFATGQFPKFLDDVFALKGEHPYYLIPTSEVSVINTVRDSIIDEHELPLKYVCHTPCFEVKRDLMAKILVA